MFEQFTEEFFMDQARRMGEELGVDTREGSIYMDAATGHCIRAAKFYEDLRTMFIRLAASTCSGEVLDEWASREQIYRKQATPSYYIPIFSGVDAAGMVGDRFMAAGYYFVLVQEADGFYLQSEIPGTATNYILPGETVIPVRNTMGLSSAKLGEMYAAGTDEEGDEELRGRWQDALTKPAENWNKQQFKTVCESYDGVGRSIIFPLAYGPCTVRAVIVSSEGTAPPNSLIEQMQLEMDPGSEGLGQGRVLLGAKFYAEAATEQKINVRFVAVLSPGYSKETVEASIREALVVYFKDISLSTPDEEEFIVQYMRIIGILANIKGIKDLSDLDINGVRENISMPSGNIPVLGELNITETATIHA